MWPWEHLAFGYLLYSLGTHLTRRASPSGEAAVVLGASALLPDLVDKPLSWGLGLFPTGYAVAHSVFVALPAGLLAVLVAVRWDRPALGVAAAVGYWSHLVGDALNPLRTGGSVDVGRLMWPVVAGQPYEREYGLRRGVVYLVEFAGELLSTPPVEVVLFHLLLPMLALGAWLLDGAPGVGLLRSLAADAVRR